MQLSSDWSDTILVFLIDLSCFFKCRFITKVNNWGSERADWGGGLNSGLSLYLNSSAESIKWSSYIDLIFSEGDNLGVHDAEAQRLSLRCPLMPDTPGGSTPEEKPSAPVKCKLLQYRTTTGRWVCRSVYSTSGREKRFAIKRWNLIYATFCIYCTGSVDWLSIGEEFSVFFIVLFPALVHLWFMIGYHHNLALYIQNGQILM